MSRTECNNLCSSNTVWNAISESCVSGTRLYGEGKVDAVDVDDGLLPSSVSKGDDCRVYAVFDSSTSPDSTSGNERADYTFSQPAGLWVVAGSKTFKSKPGESIEGDVFNDITSRSNHKFEISSDSNAKTGGKSIDTISFGFYDSNGAVLSGTDVPTSVQKLSSFP